MGNQFLRKAKGLSTWTLLQYMHGTVIPGSSLPGEVGSHVLNLGRVHMSSVYPGTFASAFECMLVTAELSKLFATSKECVLSL